jgi:hypothetical protein
MAGTFTRSRLSASNPRGLQCLKPEVRLILQRSPQRTSDRELLNRDTRPHRILTISLALMREASRTEIRVSRLARVAALACLLGTTGMLAGCAGSGGGASSAFAMAGEPATITFDSVDGPPPQIFERMVSVLESESKLRSMAIVSREGPAAYRVRSYLSAQIIRGRTLIAWVWDVYDRDQQRALRLSGEEPAGKSGRDPWGTADDLVLRKIAQAGLSGLSSMLNGMPQRAPGYPAPTDGTAVALQSSWPASPGVATGALGYNED